jgi:hypothetical protein
MLLTLRKSLWSFRDREIKLLVSYTLTLYFGIFQPHDDVTFPMCKNTH